MSEIKNPKSWTSLNWDNQCLIQYFGSINEDLSSTKMSIDKPQGKCELSNSILSDVIDSNLNSNLCRISGLKIYKQNDKICSSILPLSDLVMLCGLPDMMFKQETEKLLQLMDDSNLTYEYELFQKQLWDKTYHWIHRVFQETKKSFPMLSINYKSTKVIIDDINYNNIMKLLGEVFYHKSKNKKRTKSKSRSKVTKSNQSSLLSNYKIMNLEHFLVDRLEKVSQDIFQIQKYLEEYNSEDLRLFSYISSIVFLRVVINKLTIVNSNISLLVEKLRLDHSIYYDEDNLSNDTIQSVLDTPVDDLDVFSQFIRCYLNLETILLRYDNSVNKESLNELFKQSLLNVIDYIWNLWSKKNGIQEVKVKGSGNELDKLANGDQLDNYAKKYEDELFYIKLLSEIGDKVTDDYSEVNSENGSETEVESEVLNSSINLSSKSDIDFIEFKLGDNIVYSNLSLG